MMFNPRRARLLISSLMQNPFQFQAPRRPRGRRASKRQLYLEFLEERVLLTVTLQAFSETIRHHGSYTFAASDFTTNFNSNVNNNLMTLEITSLPSNGTLTLAGSPMAAGQTVDVSQIPQITYTPSISFAGTDSLNWNASDGESFAGAPSNVSFHVENAAPTISDVNKFARISTPTTFQASDFTPVFSDTDPNDNHNPQAVWIVTFPSHGTLQLNGNALFENETISISDVANLVYTPETDYSGADSFTWNANDGFQFAASSALVNLSISSRPVLSDINKTAHQNTPLNFTASDFTAAFSDVPGASIVSIEFTTLPTHGTLTLNGTDVTRYQTISLSDVTYLTYTPETNFSGSDTIGWNASDSSSSAQSDAVINITIGESIPTLTNVTKYIPLNTTAAFNAANFGPGFLDVDPGDNHNPQIIQIVSLPTHGVLQLDGASVFQGQAIAIGQITSLTYVPATDFIGSDSFTWNASDGVQFATSSAAVNLTVIHRPVVSDISQTLRHNTPYTFPLAAFTNAFSDADAALTNIKVTALPSHGTLTFNGTAVALDQVISVSSLSQLLFRPAANYTGTDAFGWNGGIGEVFADTPAQVNLDVQNVAPTVGNVTVSAKKNAPTAFTLSNFTTSFLDADSGDSLQAIRITSLPAAGLLKLNALPVAFNQVIAASDIPNLSYTPGSAAVTSDSFTWEASDGSLFATASAAVTLSIVNAAPSLSNISLSTARNTRLSFKTSTFTAAFHDADPGDSLSFVSLSLPTYGTLSLAGVPIVNSQIIPLSQLGKLTYKPNSGFAGTDTVFWNSSDGTGTASNIASLSILVGAVAPSVGPIAKGLIQNATGMGFDAWDFTNAFKEPNIGPILQSVTIASLPTHGTLTLNGANVTKGQIIAASSIASLAYRPAFGFTGTDVFYWKGSNGIRTSGSSAAVSLKVIPQTVLTVYGNNAVIPSGNTRTSNVNFTDFGPLSIITNIDNHSDTRTFTITNRSSAAINFKDTVNPVHVSGANPRDFSASGLKDSISQTALTSLAAGQSATFTITFKPTVTGTRTATIRLPNSAGSDYTFNVSGSGLNTFNNNFSFSTLYGLQYAVLQTGAGNGAPDGSVLTMNYTGYLLDGTRFDSSLNPGRSAFQFQLGASSVIKGWDPGLVGIKRGEKRVLIIPAALAYGSAGRTGIPANATLIFIVQCLDIGLPRVGVAVDGISNYITPGSTIASRTEGTLFPMMSLNQTASSVAFSVFDSGYQDSSGGITAQLRYTGATIASSFLLSGADASDFSLHTTSNSTFAVTFHRPADTAPRTATVSVLTNDPVHPTFTFTIQAASGFDDLVPILAPAGFPSSTITSGDQTDLALPLIVRNFGDITSSGITDIQIFALNTATQTRIPLSTLANQDLGGIAAFSSRSLTLHATLPPGFPAGTYQFGVTLNPSGALIETSTANNTTLTTQTLTVTQGLADLAGTLVSDTVPNSFLSNATVGGSVTLLVANPGPLPMPAGQQVTIQIVAHNSSTSADTVLSTSAPLSVANLASGQSLRFTVPVKYTGHLAGGDYLLEARILPVQNLAESDTANNLVTLGTAGQQLTLTSVTAFVDFAATLGTPTLPSAPIVSGDRTVLTLPVIITNRGNIPSTGSGNITLFVLNTSTQTTTNILTLTNQNFAALAPNASRTLTLTCTLPFGITTGTYELGVNLNPSKAILESDYANNSASSTQTFDVIQGTPDLTGALVSTTLATSIVGATPITSNLVVTVTNAGNILLPANQQITLTILAHNIALGHDTTLATTSALSVVSLAAGASKTFTVTINNAAGLTYGNYWLEALITPVQSLLESNTSNNLITTTSATDQHLSVFVATPAYDLTAALGAVTLPAATVTSGDRTALTLPLIVTNQGNITSAGTSDITIFALDTAGGTTTITTLTNQNLGSLAPNASRTLTLSTTLPFGFTTGTYQLGVTLNPSQTITESSFSNNTVTTTQTIDVLQGLPDLTGALVSTSIPANIIGGQPITSNLVVTVTNAGNVLLPANQQITITVLAHNADTGADTTLATSSALSVASLASGASMTFTLPISHAAGLAAGEYTLQAQITPAQSLLESGTTNNLLTTTNATDQQLSVAVAAPIYDLAPTLRPVTLPATPITSGDRTVLTLPITITNLGNVTSTGSSDIRIFALDTSSDLQTTITVLTNQNLGGIAPNTSRTLTLTTTLPYGFTSGTFELGATLNPSHAITESTYTNNSVTTTQTIDVTQGIPDLAGTLVSTSVKPAVFYFSPLSGSLVVQVANIGNVLLPANQQITLKALAHSTTSGQDTTIGTATVSVASLAAGASKTFTISINEFAGLPADTFLLEALIVPVQSLPEADTANNRIATNASGQNFSIVSNGPFFDFSAAFRTTSFPAATIISGDGTSLSLPITVTNNGNAASVGTSDISIFAVNPSTQAQTPIVTLANQNLGGINPFTSRSLTLTATLPIGFSAGTYQLGITINPSHTLLENNYTNNSAVSAQTITVDQGLAFLTGTLASSLPTDLTANSSISGAINVTIANQGNVRLPAGQQITLTIVAHNTDTGVDFTLATTSALSVASLIAGGSTTFAVNVNDTTGLLTGSYVIQAQISPIQTLPEYASANNLITLTAASAAVPLTIT
jgi:hypothetical protein